MKAPARALIVEDTDEWVFILRKAAQHAGASEVVICQDLESVREALRRARFDVAILDVGLDPKDQADATGTKVLELVRSVDGDSTRCILVTGWQGGDRMALLADLAKSLGVEGAYMKERYDGPTVIEKLDELFNEATEVRLTATPPMPNLAAGVDQHLFEAELLKRLSNPSGGIQTIYYVLSKIINHAIPLVAKDPRAPMASGNGTSLLGAYWSRALSTAVAVELGYVDDARDAGEITQDIQDRLSLFERPQLLAAGAQRKIAGRLWELPGMNRNEFPE